MSEINIFEEGIKQKVRFKAVQSDGKERIINMEDLYDLPLMHKTRINLDAVAIEIADQLDSKVKSFVTYAKGSGDADTELLKLKLAIVKHVIEFKLNEEAQAKLAAANKIEKQKLAKVIENLENKELENMDLETLKARYKEL